MMKDKITGIFLVVGAIILILSNSIYIEGAYIEFHYFISLPTFIFVILMAFGLSFIDKCINSKEDWNLIVKNNMINAGWIGLIIGLQTHFFSIPNEPDVSLDIFMKYLISGFGHSLKFLLYGFVLSPISGALLKK